MAAAYRAWRDLKPVELNNSQLTNFVSRIKLTREKKQNYASQIHNLIATVQKVIKEQTGHKVTRVLRAGSWKKGTGLRPNGANPLDIDLVFFLAVDGDPDISTLHDTLLAFLKLAYPNKDDDDFKSAKKTVGLVFRGSGLEADLVPVVPIPDTEGYVWQPEPGGTGSFVTSVDGQLQFVRDLKEDSSNYTSVVRMLKEWRNWKELELSSFCIELVQAHLELTTGVTTNLEDGVIRFFQFVSNQPHFPGDIAFEAPIGAVQGTEGAAYIADPTNNANNTAARITDAEWSEVVGAALEAFERLKYAQSIGAVGRSVGEWKAVFGPRFNIEPEET